MLSYDSSGTDDDLPPPHQSRMVRGGSHISGNGRPGAFGSVPYTRAYDESDMEAQIHELEREAYISVLRAFKAQADAISWDKETLMSDLRKELNLTNEEHSDLLKRVNADETIRRIREWRQSGVFHPGMHAPNQPLHDPLPSPSIAASRKKQKISSSLPSQSFGGPSPFHPQAMATAKQPAPSAAKNVSAMGTKGKKQKPMHSGPSSLKTRFPTGPGARGGQFANRIASGAFEPAEGTSSNPLIGRRVRTRWPDDNNFYEAVITDYNPIDDRHALSYDMGTANETVEWVDLSEISPDDIQWEGEAPLVSRHGRSGPGFAGHGRGPMKGPTRKDIVPPQNGIGKKEPEDIQLLHTESLIKEVEKVINASQPDPGEIEKAKRVLKDHEQALTDAIARLGELSDGESGGGGRFLHGQPME